MFKLEVPEITYFLKSYNINELWRFIITNPNYTYVFYFDFEPTTNDEFLHLYLQETNCYADYLRLYRALKTLFTTEKLLQ